MQLFILEALDLLTWHFNIKRLLLLKIILGFQTFPFKGKRYFYRKVSKHLSAQNKPLPKRFWFSFQCSVRRSASKMITRDLKLHTPVCKLCLKIK